MQTVVIISPETRFPLLLVQSNCEMAIRELVLDLQIAIETQIRHSTSAFTPIV